MSHEYNVHMHTIPCKLPSTKSRHLRGAPPKSTKLQSASNKRCPLEEVAPIAIQLVQRFLIINQQIDNYRLFISSYTFSINAFLLIKMPYHIFLRTLQYRFSNRSCRSCPLIEGATMMPGTSQGFHQGMYGDVEFTFLKALSTLKSDALTHTLIGIYYGRLRIL